MRQAIFILAVLLIALAGPVRAHTFVRMDSIWALDMPGTIDVRALSQPDDTTLVESIRGALSKLPNPVRQTGMVVEGQGLPALRHAHHILCEAGDRSTEVTATGRQTLVVFSGESSWYFRVRRVVVDGDTITVEFEMAPHKTKELTTHFALIPLDLKPGKYHVVMSSTPKPGKRAIGLPAPSPAEAEKAVSQGFDFTIR